MIESISIAVFSFLIGALCFAIGYRSGWDDCKRHHSRTVTAVSKDGFSITISSVPDLKVGDRIFMGIDR